MFKFVRHLFGIFSINRTQFYMLLISSTLIRIVLLFALQFDLLPLLSMLESSFGQGKGVTSHDFRYRHAAGVPGPNHIHKISDVKKADPFIYLP